MPRSRRPVAALAFVALVGLAVWALRGCGEDAGPGAPTPSADATPTDGTSADADAAPGRPGDRTPVAPRTRAAAPASAPAPGGAAAAPPPTDFAEGPASSGEVVGKVLLLPDRTPIRGAHVRWNLVDRSLAITGVNGVFRVRDLRPGDASFEVVVEARPPRTFRVTVPENGGVDGVEVLFGGTGGTIEGRCATASGPVVGAAVRLAGAASPGRALLVSPTEPDGSFRFEEVAPGSYRVEVGDAFRGRRSASVTVAAGETARVELGGDAAVSGLLRVDGAPLAEATVRLVRLGTQPAHAEERSSKDGAFRFDGLAAGPWRLSVQTHGPASCAIEIREVTLVPGENRVDAALGEGEHAASVAGRVFARTNDVALGPDLVQITLHTLEEKAAGAWAQGAQVAMAFADGEGRYRVPGLRAGRYRLRATPTRSPLLGPVTVDVDLAWGERRSGVDLALPDRVRVETPPSVSTLSGTVLEGEERPVSNAEVRATSAADANRRRSATTDDAGRYRIDGLDPGAWRISVGSYGPGGFSTEVAEIAIAAGENALPIRLDQGDLAGEIRGRVFAASSGRALGPRDVSVVLYRFGDGGPRFVGIPTIADDGAIRFRSLREGRYRISVHPRAGSYRMRDVDVSVARGEKVGGVEVALEDLASGKVVVVARDAEGRPFTDVLLVFGTGEPYVQGSTNAHSPDGVFETWVEAGTHDLTVKTWSGSLAATTKVEVRAGETSKVEVVLRPR